MEIAVSDWTLGPWNIFFLVLILASSLTAILSGRHDGKFVAAAFAISWIGAQLVTITGDVIYSGVGTVIAAAVCVYANSTITNLIAFCYALRILVAVTASYGIIAEGVMWAWTELFLLIQILLVTDDFIGDAAKRKFIGRIPFYRRAYNLIRSAI
jgi:hypothetical protein